MIMDKVCGAQLSDVWQDKPWWSGERSREALFDSLAGYMVEPATLEFDKIGRLDRTGPDGARASSPHTPLLPGTSASRTARRTPSGPASLHARILDRTRCGEPAPARGQGGLGPPFTPGRPDYNPQNVFVDDAGRLVGFVGWDGVRVSPRYEALAEEDLHKYRTGRCARKRSGARPAGGLTTSTRNAHLVVSLHTAAGNLVLMFSIMLKLGPGQYVFGSENLTSDVLEAINHSGWLTGAPEEAAQAKYGNNPLQHSPWIVHLLSDMARSVGRRQTNLAEGSASHHSGDDADAPADENNQGDAVSQTGHQRGK
ncbi:hypothetical protein BD413DRAFT_655545 [Trametes elegans]|nr:hypothetical protein BD413DRAFT_655545 [Trametes elegans]